MTMQRKQPAAVVAATKTLILLAQTQGLDAVHVAYADAIGAVMAEDARTTWRERIFDAQKETFALLEEQR